MKDTKDWKENKYKREILVNEFGKMKGTGRYVFTETEIDLLLKEAREEGRKTAIAEISQVLSEAAVESGNSISYLGILAELSKKLSDTTATKKEDK